MREEDCPTIPSSPQGVSRDDGNVNNDNKTNNQRARAVRGGLWSAPKCGAGRRRGFRLPAP